MNEIMETPDIANFTINYSQSSFMQITNTPMFEWPNSNDLNTKINAKIIGRMNIEYTVCITHPKKMNDCFFYQITVKLSRIVYNKIFKESNRWFALAFSSNSISSEGTDPTKLTEYATSTERTRNNRRDRGTPTSINHFIVHGGWFRRIFVLSIFLSFLLKLNNEEENNIVLSKVSKSTI